MATPAALLPEEEAALSEYAAVCRSAKAELRDVWLDLELGEEAVRTEMQQIMFRAHMVWNEAVAQAKERQRQLGVQVEEAGREARSIQEELGQAVHQRVYLSVGQGGEEAPTSALTTHARLERAKRELEFWRCRKAERLELMNKLQAEATRLRGLLGTLGVRSHPGCNISDQSLELIRGDIESLRSEQVERAKRMGEAILRLKEACWMVGEEYMPYAIAAHKSLSAFETLVKEEWNVKTIAPGDTLADANLSDETFHGLGKKIDAVEALKAERERQLQDVLRKLQDLWDCLQMAEGNVDRDLVTKLIESPERLFPGTFDKCHKEFERLEVKKASKTCHTIRVKYDDYLKLVAEAHLEDQGVGALVQALQGGPGKDGPMAYVQKVGETLARVQQGIEEVKIAMEKRADMLSRLESIQGAVAEVQWLKEYEQDTNRFKGRDSTRNLQRSIKAEKVRAQLPALLDGTIQALADWEDFEGEDFMYDGVCYKAHLTAMREEAEQVLLTKSCRPGAARTAAPRAHAMPPNTPSRAKQAGATRGAPTAQTPARKPCTKPDPRDSMKCSTGRPASSGPATPATATKGSSPSDATLKRVSSPLVAKPLARKSRLSPTDENEEIIGGKDRPVTGAALFATTISPMKELQELNINSPKEGPQGVESKRSDSPKPLTTKRGLQIEIAEENLEPPAKQLTPLSQATTPSDTPNGFGKKQSMLRQPTTARRSMRT